MTLRYTVPHPIPYQGSKRRLADAVLSHMQDHGCVRLIEPFAGSAAVTLAAASRRIFQRFVLGDTLDPLMNLWQQIINAPSTVADGYEFLWNRERANPIAEYYLIRDEFNAEREPAKLLYLLARCVKNAVRFNPSGDFNQSPDKRRKGTRPETMRSELGAASVLLRGRCETVTTDFMKLFENARDGDFFYLDPPYQGTSEGRDRRYFSSVSRDRMIHGLSVLNERNIPFVLSYDGSCGGVDYGDALPIELAKRLLLDVGRSSQATLNGRDDVTIESLYLSRNLQSGYDSDLVPLSRFSPQSLLFV